MEWEKLTIPEVITELNTTQDGLSSSDAEERLEKHGKNVLKEKKKESELKKFLLQFTEPLMILLILAGIVSALINDFLDSAVIFFVVILNAVLGYRQERKAQNAMEKLKSMTTITTVVLRDNQKQEINVEDITVGDAVILEEGDNVPADVRLIETYDLKVDESLLTGESLAVTKTATDENDNHENITGLHRQA